MVSVEPYRKAQFDAVDALWRLVFADDPPHSRAGNAIPRKLVQDDDLLLVAVEVGEVQGTIMAGYDGHRGWLYKLAVHPNARRCGIGEQLVRAAEERLAELGCDKVNLQVRIDNEDATRFWSRMGYAAEPRLSMGRRLG